VYGIFDSSKASLISDKSRVLISFSDFIPISISLNFLALPIALEPRVQKFKKNVFYLQNHHRI